MQQVKIGKKASGSVAWLDAPAAASYLRMVGAGCPSGGITDAGRTNAEQWVLWYAYLRGDLAATAAYPGTSLHETGRALDLAGPARAWVRAWGEPYGWIRDMVRNEPWHMTYVASRDTRATQTVSNPVATTPAIPTIPEPTAPTLDQEDDMPYTEDHLRRMIRDEVRTVLGIGGANLPLSEVSKIPSISTIGERTRDARDEIKLHRQAAAKGQE